MCDLRYSLIVASVLNCVSATGHAQWVYASTYGAGSKSCGAYLTAVYGHGPGESWSVEHAQKGKFYDEHSLHEQWLLGFITATNLSGTGSNIKTDTAALDVWMRKWCEQNPTKKVTEAALAFIQDQRR